MSPYPMLVPRQRRRIHSVSDTKMRSRQRVNGPAISTRNTTSRANSAHFSTSTPHLQASNRHSWLTNNNHPHHNIKQLLPRLNHSLSTMHHRPNPQADLRHPNTQRQYLANLPLHHHQRSQPTCTASVIQTRDIPPAELQVHLHCHCPPNLVLSPDRPQLPCNPCTLQGQWVTAATIITTAVMALGAERSTKPINANGESLNIDKGLYKGKANPVQAPGKASGHQQPSATIDFLFFRSLAPESFLSDHECMHAYCSVSGRGAHPLPRGEREHRKGGGGQGSGSACESVYLFIDPCEGARSAPTPNRSIQYQYQYHNIMFHVPYPMSCVHQHMYICTPNVDTCRL